MSRIKIELEKVLKERKISKNQLYGMNIRMHL